MTAPALKRNVVMIHPVTLCRTPPGWCGTWWSTGLSPKRWYESLDARDLHEANCGGERHPGPRVHVEHGQEGAP